MTPAHAIARKRDGHALGQEEIAAFVDGFTKGDIPDYQMSALAMAIYFRGLSPEETAALTAAMLASGGKLPRRGLRVDKHSTGGIGDKTSLILAPLLASCGLVVPMISGRGLGATGGTLDKLESIPGFRTNLSLAEIDAVLQRVGCVITGATDEIAPADKKLYALRDVTATVPSIPLITASIMSKKLAESLDALVLDVKVGNGAFMKTLDQARELARLLVTTGRNMGVKTAAFVTQMNQPLGRMAGNLVEVHEAIEALHGRGPPDLWECTRELGAELLLLVGKSATREAARQLLDEKIASGDALQKFRDMVAAQGGQFDGLPPLICVAEVLAEVAGYVQAIETEQLGLAIIEMGGGRLVLTDTIDHAVGLEMLVSIGDRVSAGQPLIRVYGAKEAARWQAPLRAAVSIEAAPVDPLPVILERIAWVGQSTALSYPGNSGI